MIDRLNLNSWRTSVTRPDNSFRMFYISILAAIIGILWAGLVAYALFTLDWAVMEFGLFNGGLDGTNRFRQQPDWIMDVGCPGYWRILSLTIG